MSTSGAMESPQESRSLVPAIAVLVVTFLGLVLFVLLAAESGTPDQARDLRLTYYPEPVAKPGYTLTKECIGERRISAYLLSADEPGEQRRPAVILIHGGSVLDMLTSSKPQYKGEWFIPLFEHIPYRLADAGMLVIAIDAWWAGERYEPERMGLAQTDPVAAVLRGYVETTLDVFQVIDHLLTRDDVNPSRVGVAGKSGGGIVSLMAACKEDRIEAVVAWKAGADFVRLAHLRGEATLVNRALNNDSGFREAIQYEDPIHQYQTIPPKALALIGNHDDPLMPRQGAEALYEKLLPLYGACPERLMLKLFDTPRPTHDLQPRAFEMGCEWLEKSLGPERGETPQ